MIFFKSLTFSIAFSVAALTSISQVIKIEPYLQDAGPHSISIMWETDMAEESIVEWGLTVALGNSTVGIAHASEGDARIHEVTLIDLERFTQYYYRVITDEAISDIYSFKTAPFSSDNQSFRIVAMSDMQNDAAFPTKFEEVVNDGVIDYLETEYGGELTNNLALVMIPGDLVANGNDFASWETTFFDQAQNLFAHVPVYPVLGNHEVNASHYFKYFKLPENGTQGFEEHWWHKDYGNVRIIGLNSNSPYDNFIQLDWLAEVLDNTCAEDSIDFVFAQLHHPHKSELWTPGESIYTGAVIDMLEQFTTDCGKPSIHFFGHTHGYSRGHSRDHKHLWINVATAGGAIDNWGEFPNADYDEFAVSQDEYGFVEVQVINDDDPRVVVKRISRGDQDGVLDNPVTDSVVMRLNPTVVNTPIGIYPVDITIAPECVVLAANDFASPNTDSTHGQSHWQVALMQDDFDNPVADSWKNFENWYFEEDTQASDDLTDEAIPGLNENTQYWWRVRYRDKELNWSQWSASATFQTGEAVSTPNLISNSGAENNLDDWTTTQGVAESLIAFECAGVAPYQGLRYFGVGGLCEHSDVGVCVQNVDVSSYQDSIDAGSYSANFGGFLSDYNGSDLPEMRIIFWDENDVELGSSVTLSTFNSSWTAMSIWEDIPIGTKTIQMELKGTRNSGEDNDSYFDEVFLKLAPTFVDCSGDVSIQNYRNEGPVELSIVPNPVHEFGFIEIPAHFGNSLHYSMIDEKGSKVSCPLDWQSEGLQLSTEALASGNYFYWIRDGQTIVGRGKLVVQ